MSSYLRHRRLDFPAANLLVQGIEQLLSRGGPGEGRPLVQRAAEESAGRGSLRTTRLKVTQSRSMRSMILGGPVGQFLDPGESAGGIFTVDRVVEVLPLAVAQLPPGQVVDAVDAALGTDAVRDV